MIPLVGAGKGDVPMPADKRTYDANYEKIFGKRKISGRFKRTVLTFGKKPIVKKNESGLNFYVPDLTPRFNRGLGRICSGTRDAEKKAKRMGLAPIGDARMDQVFKKEKGDMKPILVDGLKRLKALKEA